MSDPQLTAFARNHVLELRHDRDFLDNFGKTSAQVQAFLDVPYSQLEVDVRKQALATAQDRVSNYSAVRPWFRHTPNEGSFTGGSGEW